MRDHTPIPWKAVKYLYADDISIETAGGDTLASVYGDDLDTHSWPATANAAFIVKAANAHDDLLEACKASLEILRRVEVHHQTGQVEEMLELVIAKAEGR